MGREDAGNDIEGDQALGARVLAVDGEGDTEAMKERVRLGALLREALRRLLVEPAAIVAAMRRGVPSASNISSYGRPRTLPPAR